MIVDGIKGFCWFVVLKYYDFIRGSVVDYMYCVLEGVMKLFFKLWFGSGYSNEIYCIVNRIFEVDNRLVEIKFFNNISRGFRFIENYSKYWKVSEFRFFFFYGVVVLNGIFLDVWYEYFMLLSDVENLIEYFCVIFAEFYGMRY